ncbi:MAG: NusA N-terminal domain-containing protein, partial [Candidatus Oleimicrobiaceae bacterium]
MKSEIVEAFAEMAKERNVDKEVLAEIIESVFMNMIKKRFGATDNFDIFVNFEKGEIEIYQNKTIVDEVT